MFGKNKLSAPGNYFDMIDAQVKKKKRIKFIIFICVILLLVIVGKFVIPAVKRAIMERRMPQSKGYVQETKEELRERLASEDSDIEGMSKLDKYEMGLDVWDGSDTDHDGLTDAVEIMITNSDPLSSSTSGDGYTDGYKVSHGMNVLNFYEIDESISANECPEVILNENTNSIYVPVVVDSTAYSGINGVDVYRTYHISDYSGNISIDTTQIPGVSNLSKSEREFWIETSGEVKKVKASDDGDGICKLDYSFDVNEEYEVHVAKKSNFIGRVVSSSKIKNAKKNLTSTIRGKSVENGIGIYYGSIFTTYLGINHMKIYVEDLGDDESNELLKEKILADAANSSVALTEGYNCFTETDVRFRSRAEIQIRYMILDEFLAWFKTTPEQAKIPNFKQFVNLFYMFVQYGDIDGTVVNSAPSLFDLMNGSGNSSAIYDEYDFELPFQNFGTEVNESGLCAGFARLTSKLYNGETVPISGNYGNIVYNLSADSNTTLTDAGLSDCRTYDWTDKNAPGGDVFKSNLSADDYEMVKLIEHLWEEENSLFYYGDYASMAEYSYDYAMIEEVMERIDRGEMVDVHMLSAHMVRGEYSGHAVNIYGYYEDENDPNLIHFMVYDSNYPDIYNAESGIESAYNLDLQVRKHKFIFRASGDTQYSFSYTYQPVVGDNMVLYTSKKELRDEDAAYAIIFVGKNDEVINKAYPARDALAMEDIDLGDVESDGIYGDIYDFLFKNSTGVISDDNANAVVTWADPVNVYQLNEKLKKWDTGITLTDYSYNLIKKYIKTRVFLGQLEDRHKGEISFTDTSAGIMIDWLAGYLNCDVSEILRGSVSDADKSVTYPVRNAKGELILLQFRMVGFEMDTSLSVFDKVYAKLLKQGVYAVDMTAYKVDKNDEGEVKITKLGNMNYGTLAVNQMLWNSMENGNSRNVTEMIGESVGMTAGEFIKSKIFDSFNGFLLVS